MTDGGPAGNARRGGESGDADRLVEAALAEDVGDGDRTTAWSVPAGARGAAAIVSRREGVIAGGALVERVFGALSPDVRVELGVEDGGSVEAGDPVCRLRGPLAPILTGEASAEDWSDRAVFASAAYSDLPEDYFDDPEAPYFEPPEDADDPFHSRVERLTWQPEERTAMIRTRDWKLIVNESRDPELYHLEGRRGERQNVAGAPEYEDVMQQLQARLREVWAWRR